MAKTFGQLCHMSWSTSEMPECKTARVFTGGVTLFLAMLCRMPCLDQSTESSHNSSARAATQRPWRDGVVKLLCVCYMHHVLFFWFCRLKWMSRPTALRNRGSSCSVAFKARSMFDSCNYLQQLLVWQLFLTCQAQATFLSWNRSIRSTHAYCERLGRCTGHARAPYHTVWCECRIQKSRGSPFFGEEFSCSSSI